MTKYGGLFFRATCESSMQPRDIYKYAGFLRSARDSHYIETQIKKAIMQQQILSILCSSLLFAFAVDAKGQFDPGSYAREDVITRDVAVVGGGASGTFSAINLRRLGKSVVLIERDAELGGHTNTYTDPSTSVSIDYGTQAFWNSMSSNLFSRSFRRSKDALYGLQSQYP